MEILRVYKRGSATYTDITSATAGGFTDLTVTLVRNAPGSLDVTLAATTIGMLHEWIDEVAEIELYEDTTLLSRWIVDEYTPRWSDLSATIKASGWMVKSEDTVYTGEFSSKTLKQCLHTLGDAEPSWLVDDDLLDVTGNIEYMAYEAKSLLGIVQELCAIGKATFWIDADCYLNAAMIPETAGVTYNLPTPTDLTGDLAYEFETSYSARDIVNRLVLTTALGTATHDEEDSQAAYGIRAASETVDQLKSSGAITAYVAAVFRNKAWPRREMRLSVMHDPTLRPGEVVEITGVDDERTYQEVLQQVTFRLGEKDDELLLGYTPTIIVQARPAPTPNDNGSGGSGTGTEGTPGSDGTGGGLVRGTITAYDSDTNTCTFQPDAGGDAWTEVAVAVHIGTPEIDAPCWVGDGGG